MTEHSKDILRFKKESNRPLVCIQGLGFVGAAMCVATANAKNEQEQPIFDVIGLDLKTDNGRHRVQSLNNGIFPFSVDDENLTKSLSQSHKIGNLKATTDERCLKYADIVIVDIHLDIEISSRNKEVSFENFLPAIKSIGKNIRQDTLIIIETTVPPGTCQNIILPCLREEFLNRNLDSSKILLAHSYERVMPGPDYLNSIINFWRVYAGANEQAASACEDFLRKVINTDKYPLTQLTSMTSSETAKIIENTYRAVNIALIDEWGKFAEIAEIDIFEIIQAIQVRPTHSNIRRPGFGVGGYCLTKDPYFGQISINSFFNHKRMSFPFANLALETNREMPIRNLDKIEQLLDEKLEGKNLILMGIAYRSEVDDTRYSASEIFYNEAIKRGLNVIPHDPFVEFWTEKNINIETQLPNPDSADIVVFTVAHKYYQELNIEKWLERNYPFIFDANNVLGINKIQKLRALGFRVASTGRG